MLLYGTFSSITQPQANSCRTLQLQLQRPSMSPNQP